MVGTRPHCPGGSAAHALGDFTPAMDMSHGDAAAAAACAHVAGTRLAAAFESHSYTAPHCTLMRFDHFHSSLLFYIRFSYFCVDLNYFCKL